MITLIIFSKNRPLQLDLCLSSIAQHFNANYTTVVLYSCDEEYENAYKTLKQEHENVMFWKQGKSLFEDIFVAINSYDNLYCCFLTDDCIMYQQSPNLNNENLNNIFAMENICCFSLRLGSNITKRGFKDELEFKWFDDKLQYVNGLNVWKNGLGFICWDRTQHLYGGYWNYPISVDGHIFRAQDLSFWMEELVYIEPIKKWNQTPNEVERGLQRFVNEIPSLVGCFESSCIVNTPNNRVQNTIKNYEGVFYPADPKLLLEFFEQGKRIKLEKLKIQEIECPHTEIDILKGLEND